MNPTCQNLRLGIVHHGRIVREAVVDRQTEVSLGCAPGCTIRLAPGPGVPEQQNVLLRAHGAWFLVLPAAGRDALHLRGVLQQAEPVLVRGRHCTPLDGAAGGSVQWGELTLLFQFVAAGVAQTVLRDQPVLRIGLVLADRLLTERAFDHPGEVVIGTSVKATLVLPTEDYAGPPLVLTRLRDGTVRLRCHAAAELATAGPSQPFQRDGDRLDTLLLVGGRARVRLGAYTLLVHVVLAQQAVAVATPRDAAGRFWRALTADRTWLASCAAAVLLVGLVLGQALAHQQRLGRFQTDLQPDETVRQTDWVPLPPQPPLPDVLAVNHTAPAQADATAQPEHKPPPTPHPTAHHEVDVDAPGRNRRDAVRSQTMAGAFRGANGAAVAMFQPDDTTEALGQTAFGRGNPDGAASAPGASALDLAAPSHVAATIERLPASATSLGPRAAAPGKPAVRSETVVKLRPLADPDDPRPGDDLGTAVGRLAARKQNAVRRCYEGALRGDAELDGKVVVRFVVGTSGSVTEVEVLGAADGFASCIQAVFQNLRGLPALPEPRSFRQSYVFSKG